MRQIVEFRDRRDNSWVWTQRNPILAEGEHGYERDTGKFKIGTGVTPWNNLKYFIPQDSTAAPLDLQEHIDNETPHPVYDDGPSLTLLYLNAKV